MLCLLLNLNIEKPQMRNSPIKNTFSTYIPKSGFGPNAEAKSIEKNNKTHIIIPIAANIFISHMFKSDIKSILFIFLITKYVVRPKSAIAIKTKTQFNILITVVF